VLILTKAFESKNVFLWSTKATSGALVGPAKESALFAAPEGNSTTLGAVHFNSLLIRSDLTSA
jgi:hypothetical protein